MWVRSQDKLRLINCKGIYIDYNNRTEISGDMGQRTADDGESSYLLGRYSSEQRAMEVLDEIQNYVLSTELSKSLSHFHQGAFLYQMPEK